MGMPGEMNMDDTEDIVADGDTTGVSNYDNADGAGPVLGYWDIRGLAQPIRFLLAYLGIGYCEKTYIAGSTESWEQDKETLGLPFPALPYYIDKDNEIYLTETLAILKYIAVKHQPSMLGKSVEDQGTVEMLSHILVNLNKIATKPCYLENADKKAIGDNCLKEI